MAKRKAPAICTGRVRWVEGSPAAGWQCRLALLDLVAKAHERLTERARRENNGHSNMDGGDQVRSDLPGVLHAAGD